MKASVLLVEDEYDTREILTRSLERAGYRCVAAESAVAARALASKGEPIDVVVTDIALGREDRGGLFLIRDLKAAGLRAPVVVITAYADVQKVKMALNEGADHLLEKPFRVPELVHAIERVRGQRNDVGHRMEEVLSRASLTDKERTVARHLLNGLSSTEIAEIEGNSPKTIRQHVSQIYAKCGVNSRAELFRLVYAP